MFEIPTCPVSVEMWMQSCPARWSRNLKSPPAVIPAFQSPRLAASTMRNDAPPEPPVFRTVMVGSTAFCATSSADPGVAASHSPMNPVAASTVSAWRHVAPSELTLIEKSSLPESPISAWPVQPDWNRRLAVSPAAALLTLS
ncbi:hypothetical protein ACFOHS_22785 [Jhaorihella thermophila]